jgi:hypothetical protein
MAIGAKRDPKKEAFWRKLIGGRAKSGLSIRAWCRRRGVNEVSFHWWRRELARRDTEPPQAAFIPVRVVPDNVPEAHGGIEIVLSGGRLVRVNGHVDRQALADVLSVLETAPC